MVERIPARYTIRPSIVPAARETELTVTAAQRVFMPFDGKTYVLRVNPVDADEIDYHRPEHVAEISAAAAGGAIRFTWRFGAEGAYYAVLLAEGQKLAEFYLYALEEDLYGLRPLKGDFHSHSYRSDGAMDCGAIAGYFREEGYDFYTLTDHNRYYPSREVREAFKDVKLGLTILNGEEVHTPGSPVHIVNAGGTESVTERYIREPEKFEAEWKAIEKELPAEIPAQYRDRYALAAWAARQIRAVGGLAILAHPYWRPGGSHSYNVTETFSTLLLMSGLFNAYELVGGMGQDGINFSVNKWSELRAERGLRIPVVGSSDAHAVYETTFNQLFSLVLARSNTREDILEAVRAGRSVAVEASGAGNDREYRCYGSLRLVTYAQFLLQHYFPFTREIAAGEGVMMRRYLLGEESGELLSAMADRVDRFYRRFAGQEAPVLPDAETLAFEEKWREIQRNGPPPKGSNLTFYNNGANRRND